jgi:hypothetical protein
MTRGAQRAANAGIQAGNGPACPRGSATGRGRVGTWIRAGAIAGVFGPAAFTLAWIAAAFRQPGLPFSAAQISGLAVADRVPDRPAQDRLNLIKNSRRP